MLKIGDFASLTKVSIKTLRHYDRVGLLKPAWINRYNGYRYYTLAQAVDLNRILVMKEMEFSLEQIRRLLHEEISPAELRGMLKLKRAELEQHIRQQQESLELIEERLRRLDEAAARPVPADWLGPLIEVQENTGMDPQIINLKAFKVVGMQVVSKNQNQEIPQLWQRMNPRWHEIQHVVNPEQCYGLCGAMNPDGSFTYLAGIEVDRVDDVPDGMEVIEVPAHSYAVFKCTIPTIGQTYEHIFNSWLPESGYEQAPSYDFEFYGKDFNPENSETDPLYLYIPLAKRS